MTDAMKRRLFAVAALVVAGAALAYISMGDVGESLVYYWSPTELVEAGAKGQNAVVRLGGQVVEGTYSWDADSQVTKFEVTDGTTNVAVVSNGNPPQMFREGIGVVVEGRMGANGTFTSDKVMVKHSNEYQAPEGEEMPGDAFKSLAAGDET